jgi:hypothetical protein
MLKNVKALLKKVARAIAEWPVVGRFVRIGAAIFRLPELKDAFLVLNHRQHVFETEQVPAMQHTISGLNHQLQALQQMMLSLNHRQHIFETEQVPALLQTIEALNQHQLFDEDGQDNLLKSVPVILRKITRDLIDLRGQLQSATDSSDPRIGEA